MDYKELVKKLREKDGCHCECLKAATAIETLLGNGRPSVRPSKQFEDYRELAGYYIPKKLRLKLDRPVNVKCLYYMPTRRRVDLVNLLEATCDILVHYGVLADDHSGIAASHDGSRVLYDKKNLRAEIEIEGISYE